MNQENCMKTMTEMAKSLNLSRTRFHALVKDGYFPQPKRADNSSRPYFDNELQDLCFEVKRTRKGVNGKVIVFQRKPGEEKSLSSHKVLTKPPKEKQKMSEKLKTLMTSLKDFGLDVDREKVEQAVAALYPEGIDSVPMEEVVRAVFVELAK